MGLDTHGWQYAVTSDDCGFILNVSGLDNAAYPQTALVTFDQTEAIQLFTNDQNGDADGGVDEQARSSIDDSNGDRTPTSSRAP